MRPCTLILFFLFFSVTISNAADQIHWTFTGQTSVTVDWRGAKDENTINYGTKSGEYKYSIEAHTPSPLPFSSPGPFWEAKITELQEDTTYYYTIGDGLEYQFHTPLKTGASGFTIFVQGDIGDTGSYRRVADIQNIIADGQPDFVLGVGDLTYGNAHGQDTVDQHFNDVMVWSVNAAYMPVWGNHEWDKSTDDLRNYKGRFDFPNPQTSTKSPAISCCGEDWYWFDYGNVRFITLPEPWPGAWTEWAEYAHKLMADAQTNPDISFIVTFVHRPAYSSGHHPGNSKLKAIIDGLGEQFDKYVLNINGHSHNYERTYPQNGVTHITAGASGSGLETDGSCLWKTCTQPAWSAFRAMHHGAFKLYFTTEGIEGSYICGPSQTRKNDIKCNPGEIIDSFTIGKTVTGNDQTAPTVPTNIIATATSSQVNLKWQPSTDNVRVSGYRIYQNGRKIGSSYTSAYQISGLLPAKQYTYTISAFDPSGNTSAQSKSVTITTQTKTTNSGSVVGTVLKLTPTDDASIKPKYPTKNFGQKKLETDKRSLEHFLMKFKVSGTNDRKIVSAKLRLYNINGSNKGGDFYFVPNNAWSESTVNWNNAPASNNNIIASLGAVSANNWYSVDLSSLIKSEGTFSLRVKSTSTNGADYLSKEDKHKPQLILTLAGSNSIDTTPPTVPAGITAKTVSAKQIDLIWSVSTDNIKVEGYKIFRNGKQISTTEAPSFSDTTVSPGTTYTYTIIAVDTSGNESDQSRPSSITTDQLSMPPSNIQTLVLMPTDDATIKPSYPTKNFGSKKLEADKRSLEHFLLKFKVSGINDQKIVSAKLRLYNINGSNKGGDFYFVPNNKWSESTINWNNAPASTNSIISSLGTVTADNWYSVDLTSLIKDEGTFSIRVKSTSSNGADYYSKEKTKYSPRLIIKTTNRSSIKKTSQPKTTTLEPTKKTVASKPISFPVKNPTTSSIPLITDTSLVFSVPKLTRLPYLKAIIDPIFGTKITRIADDTGKSTFPVKGKWGRDARHHYSKDQPWNSDGTLLMLQNTGSPKQIILDGSTYQPKYGKCRNYSPWEDRWHPSKQHPHERINVNHDRLEWFDIVNCVQTRSWQLPFSVNYIGSGEGNVSNDGRYILLADDTRMFLVDMDPRSPYRPYDSGNNKRIGPAKAINDCGFDDCSVDWVSVSPSGKYAVVSYIGDHLRVFDINPKTLALSPKPMPTHSAQCGNKNPKQGYIYDLGHADMTLNPFDNNEDVIIGQQREWCPEFVDGKEIGKVVMVRLKDNKVVSLTDPDIKTYPHHISARNLDRPGWIYVGFYYYPNKKPVFNDEIVAIKIDGSMTVERLAHKHSVVEGCYRCEAHPVPSRDGRRVLWAQYTPDSKSDIKACVVDTSK